MRNVEQQFLDELRAGLLRESHETAAESPGLGLLVGAGDDAAVLQTGESGDLIAVCADSLAEGVHFRRPPFSPLDIGRKLMAVNASDIFAMAASPRYALITISAESVHGADSTLQLLRGIIRGARSFGDDYGVSIIGGDTTRSRSGLVCSGMCMGVLEDRSPVFRSGAEPGDLVYVSGPLGDAAAGLRFMSLPEDSLTADLVDSPAYKRAIQRQLCPDLSREQLLVESLQTDVAVTSMIDISDGLALDLSRVAEASGVGIQIDLELVPVGEGALLAESLGENPIGLACTGGEDYRLCLTVPSHARGELERLDPPNPVLIGTVTADGGGVRFVRGGEELTFDETGYDAFG